MRAANHPPSVCGLTKAYNTNFNWRKGGTVSNKYIQQGTKTIFSPLELVENMPNK